MTTLKAKRLSSALQKAQNVGRVEESVTISGCSLVLQNLSPTEYDLIVPELKDLDGAEYLHAHMISHLSRSIVEIEGVDLRDVQFIEDEVPVGTWVLSAAVSNENKAKKAQELLSGLGIKLTIEPPDDTGEVKNVKLEKAEWLKRQISSWGRESILVARLKFDELVDKASAKAKEGVNFKIVDESTGDKFRRLLIEAKELEAELPDELIGKILSDIGYLQQSSQKELDEVHQALALDDRLESSEILEDDVEEEPPSAPKHTLPKSDPEVVSSYSRAATSRQIAAELMQSRQPLNQGEFTAPVPVPEYPPVVKAPQQLRNAVSERTAEISALEGQIDPELLQSIDQAVQTNAPRDLMKQKPVDGKGVNTILNQPPVVGLNPKFRPMRKI